MSKLQILTIEQKDFFGTSITVRNLIVTVQAPGGQFTTIVKRSHFRKWLQGDNGFPFLMNPEAAHDDDPEAFIIAGGRPLDEAMLMYLHEVDKVPYQFSYSAGLFGSIPAAIKSITNTYSNAH